MGTLEGILLGIDSLMNPVVFGYCFLGVFVGTLIGVLPGIGALATVSLLLPVTFYVDSTSAVVMLAGVYYGAQYGGSTASVLLNVPGTASSVVACLDGYPMAQKGRAGVALFMTTIASFIGSMLGILMLVLFAPFLAKVGLEFGAAEYFALMVLGLVAASTLATGSPAKGLGMVTLGLLLGTVGTDVNSGYSRFDFGILSLLDGISLVALAMGIFGVAEIVTSISQSQVGRVVKPVSFKDMVPTSVEAKKSILPILRGTAVGGFIGALPGTGASIASFMSYALEKKVSRTPEQFGKGAIEGVTGPEAANNAAAQTSFIPTLSLGIPGDAVMALILGALIMHGIEPGPRLMLEEPALFWALIASFGLGNIFLLILNLPLIGVWVSILRIPYSILYPAILVFICLGVYSINNNTFDVVSVALFGAIGYLLTKLRFEPAPLLLGFVLGPLMEENLRRALIISYGDLTTFVTRPISAFLLACILGVLLWPVLVRKK